MAKTGKGLPRSLQNVDFGDLDISVGWGEVTGKPAVIAAGRPNRRHVPPLVQVRQALRSEQLRAAKIIAS